MQTDAISLFGLRAISFSLHGRKPGRQAQLLHYTFRTLPHIPQVFHADELVVSMETVVLGFGVMVIQVLSQELWRERYRER